MGIENIDEETKKQIIDEHESKKKNEKLKSELRKDEITYVSIGSILYFTIGVLVSHLQSVAWISFSCALIFFSIYQLIRLLFAKKHTTFDKFIFIFFNLIPYILIKFLGLFLINWYY